MFNYDDMFFNEETLQVQTDYMEECDPVLYWAKSYRILREGMLNILTEKEHEVERLERHIKELIFRLNKRLCDFDKWHDEIEIKGDLYIYLIDAKQLVLDLKNILKGEIK